MLLDSDLGNMVDLVVDLNSNLVDNRGRGNSNGSSSSNGNRCNFSRLGGIDTLHQTMSQESMSQESMSNKTMSVDTSSNDLSISISSRSSKATGHKSRKNSKRFHIDCVESIPTIPM